MKKKHHRGQAAAARASDTSPSETRSRSLLLVAISLLITLLAFLPVSKAGFVNLDDDDYVTKNSAIRSFGNATELLTEPVQGNYHPLTMLSLAVNHAVSKDAAWSYHWLNLLFHLANTLLAYRLAAKLSKNNDLVSFTTALLFGIHPMHVESVAWVAERKDVLYAFFYLLAACSYVDYADSRSKSSYLFSLLWFVLSLASKPAAVIFPLVMFLVDFFRRRGLSARLVIEKIPFFLPALVAGFLTLHGQALIGATDTAQLHDLGTRILFACYGYMMYLLKSIAPVHLSVFYPAPAVNTTLPVSYQIAPLFLAGSVIACALTARKYPVVTFGFGFFLLNLLLVLQLKIVGSAIIADRYTYIPYIGLFFLFGCVIDQLVKERKSTAYAGMIALGTILAFVSYRQAGTWKSGATLWDNAIENIPSARAFLGRAKAYRSEGDLKKAVEFYTEGLKLRQSHELYEGRANAYVDMKEVSLAMADYDKALSVKPNSVTALCGRGSLFSQMGKLDLAIKDLSLALQLDPDYKTAYRNRGLSLMNNNEHERAIEDFERYLARVPTDAEVYNAIGVCYQRLAKHEESLRYFDQALRLNPSPAYFLNRSYSWNAVGKLDEAKRDAEKAKQMGLSLPEAYARSLGLY